MNQIDMTPSPILQLERVTKQFAKTDSPAVADITLELPQGDILVLLGPSGCGKTTLLRLIAGFEQLQAGQIDLAGRTVASKDVWIAPEHRSIGMVFQDFALFPHLTAMENVAFGLKQADALRKADIGDRTREAIALVGLQGKEHRYPHQLSGGQQQRVALARALAPRPTLILLDEPLSNLDVQVRLYLRQEVRDILKATGTSAIFVTHDQEEALSIADQVAVMRQGHIEQVGSPEAVYLKPASRFVVAFVTQANFLSARRCDQGWDTEAGIFPDVAGAVPSNVSSGELMIRQEDLQLRPDEVGDVVVRDRHFLGREYCYCLRTRSGHELRARTPTTVVLPIGATVSVSAINCSPIVFPVPSLSASLQGK